MRTSEKRRPVPAAEYYYRRSLEPRELIPAVAAGIGVGFAAFYVARLLLQRTPLEVDREGAAAGRALTVVRRRPGRTAEP